MVSFVVISNLGDTIIKERFSESVFRDGVDFVEFRGVLFEGVGGGGELIWGWVGQ
jgi:hypothetical protein